MAIKKQRLILWFFVYLIIGFYFVRTTINFEDELSYHKSVLINEKEQYSTRVLFPFLVEFTSNTLELYSIPYISDLSRIYRLLYILTIALVALLFQIYLQIWFEEKIALIGTLFLLISLPFSFIITGHLDVIFDLGLFILGAMFILKNKFWPLIPIVFIGAFNRQTIMFLAFLYFLANFDEKKWFTICIKSSALLSIPIIINLLIRYFRDVLDKSAASDKFIWNLACHHCTLSLFLLFHVFWFLAFLKLSHKPIVLQRWTLSVPFFLIFNYLFGSIWETRMFLSLAIIIIPLGLFTLFSKDSLLDSFH